MTDKFSLEKFEEVIECYFLPGVLANITLLMFLDISIHEHVFSIIIKSATFLESSLFIILSLITGMVVDSTRHLVFERFAPVRKCFGLEEVPILSSFKGNSDLLLNEKKFNLYRHFTKSSYYYAEFCGNVGLVLIFLSLFLYKFIHLYFSTSNEFLLIILCGVCGLIALSLLYHYICSMQTYQEIIKSIKELK